MATTIPAPAGSTIASLWADVQRLTGELAGQTALAITATGERDTATGQRDTALAAAKKSELQRNLAFGGIVAALILGVMFGYGIAPKGGDSKALEQQVQVLAGRAQTAEKALDACNAKTGGATPPASTSAPTATPAAAPAPAMGATAAVPAVTTQIEINVNGQATKPRATVRQPAAQQPAAQQPQADTPTKTADGHSCTFTVQKNGVVVGVQDLLVATKNELGVAVTTSEACGTERGKLEAKYNKGGAKTISKD